ncbi:putative regulatory protein, FmdB family [Pseudonocardia ammonioxydans]|uniref:Putative regulatory protein, FmdB family n=1 Tax=Pseudonocardia ammonioxydans TaxID=260086 RepID=A0A1I4XLW8_PSUAM|nr:zinc ribbon domain-containing protein [Pseudonocardia ammonioxydans]SFN26792.1 putative regulatory protein, FmdB family [Pseudonocardia ammonioxydans]
MPVYDYACACGVRFETMVPSWSSPAPGCPSCGELTRRRPPSPAVHGRAAPPAAMSTAPQSWEGLNNGDRDTITHWRRRMDARQEFESRHPEHAEHRDAIAAHEGAFERRPLTYKELAARAATSKDAGTAAAEASRARSGAGTTTTGAGD